MGILEIIAEQTLGEDQIRPFRTALQHLEAAARGVMTSEAEKARIASLAKLCCAYTHESDLNERSNILRTLKEICDNEPLEMPTQSLDEWYDQLAAESPTRANANRKAELRRKIFQKKYFSLRARAGFQTQKEVALRTGLRRSYVAVIEKGAHLPQQKTLQKLALAFGVDVTDLSV